MSLPHINSTPKSPTPPQPQRYEMFQEPDCEKKLPPIEVRIARMTLGQNPPSPPQHDRWERTTDTSSALLRRSFLTSSPDFSNSAVSHPRSRSLAPPPSLSPLPLRHVGLPQFPSNESYALQIGGITTLFHVPTLRLCYTFYPDMTLAEKPADMNQEDWDAHSCCLRDISLIGVTRELFKAVEEGMACGMRINNWTDETESLVRKFKAHTSLKHSTRPNRVTLEEVYQELLFIISSRGPNSITGHMNQDLMIGEPEKITRLAELLKRCFDNDTLKIMSFLAILGQNTQVSPYKRWRICSIADQFISELKEQHIRLLPSSRIEQNWLLTHLQHRLEEAASLQSLPMPIGPRTPPLPSLHALLLAPPAYPERPQSRS